MKLLHRVLLAGGLLLTSMGSYAKYPDPTEAIRSFYQGYIKSNGVMTPALRKQLAPAIADSYKQWEQCTSGVKRACSKRRTENGYMYGVLDMEKGLHYFTKTANINPKWATQIKVDVTYKDDLNGHALATLTWPDGGEVGVTAWFDEGQWKIGLVDRNDDPYSDV